MGRRRGGAATIPTDQHVTYQLQYRKCGKPRCGTCRQGSGHGPYWYAYWREGTRLRSGYIGKVPPAGRSEAVAARAAAPRPGVAI
jgi:hypothetical protein